MAVRRRRKVTWPIVNKDDIPLRNVIEEYLQYHDGLNHSPKTVRWYTDMLGRFADWLGPNAYLHDTNADAVRGYARAVRSKGLSKFTAHSYVRTVKTFIRWLEREGMSTTRSPTTWTCRRCRSGRTWPSMSSATRR